MSIKSSGRLAEAGIEQPAGCVGVSYDNAFAETINGLYKAGVIQRRGPWLNRTLPLAGEPLKANGAHSTGLKLFPRHIPHLGDERAAAPC